MKSRKPKGQARLPLTGPAARAARAERAGRARNQSARAEKTKRREFAARRGLTLDEFERRWRACAKRPAGGIALPADVRTGDSVLDRAVLATLVGEARTYALELARRRVRDEAIPPWLREGWESVRAALLRCEGGRFRSLKSGATRYEATGARLVSRIVGRAEARAYRERFGPTRPAPKRAEATLTEPVRIVRTEDGTVLHAPTGAHVVRETGGRKATGPTLPTLSGPRRERDRGTGYPHLGPETRRDARKVRPKRGK